MLGSAPATVPTRRRGERFWTRRAAISASKDTFPPKINAIARRGRVCCATIYAVSVGKQGLLNTLMDIGSRAPVSTTLDRVDLDDPAAILRTVVATCRNVREEFGDIVRVLLATAPTAPHDTPMAASGMDVEQVSSRRLTSCGFISAIPASSLCATSTAGSYERAE